MKYGYTIADAADRKTFDAAASFIIEELHFKPCRDFVEDVDGSIKKEFSSTDGKLILVSDTQVDDVIIISDVELPIDCLYEWTTES